MKKILVIVGHPNFNSLNTAICQNYTKEAKKTFQIKLIYLSKLKFDPILHKGYKEKQKLEPDLIKAQKLIAWANHLVFIFPIWWGSIPALLKGFIDRTFLSDFAYKRQGKKIIGLLKNKTASIIATAGGPKILYKFFGWVLLIPITFAVFRFCGIKTKNKKFIADIYNLPKQRLQKLFYEIQHLGRKGI